MNMFNNPLFKKLQPFLTQYGYENGFYQQHVADAYNAEYADEKTNSTTLAFALAGLYLFAECDFTGRSVQEAHGVLAKNMSSVPHFSYKHSPVELGLEQFAKLPSPELLQKYLYSVWGSYADQQALVRSWADKELHLAEG